MLIHLIISLVAVIAFAIFEYSHNKATYSIKTAWVKYVAGLVLGTFGFSYLLKWPAFQYVLQAAFVVAFLFFFWAIVQKFKIKGVPGQPLKVVAVGLLLLGATSCSKYSDTISGQVVQTGDACHYRPVDPATIDSAAKGWVSIELTDGNPLICRVDVKTDASWPQKFTIANHKGRALLTYVFWAVAAIAIFFGIVKGNKGGGITVVVGSFALAIVLFCFGAASINWAITKEFSMPKVVYDNPDARHAYEDANLYL